LILYCLEFVEENYKKPKRGKENIFFDEASVSGNPVKRSVD